LKEKNDLKICYVDISYRTRELMKLPGRWHQILSRISAAGHEIAYVTICPLLGMGNPYISYGSGFCFSLGKALATDADIFLANGLETGALSYISKSLGRRKFVFDYAEHYAVLARYEGDTLRAYYTPCLLNVVPSLADHVIVVKEEFRKRCLSRGVLEGKITVIPNGVDTRRFNPDDKGQEIREELGIGENPLVVYVGKLEEYYNLDVLIEAASIVIRHEPSARFLLVGPGRSSTRLKALAKNLGISDSVILAGFQPYDRVPHFIGAADVTVFPHSEGLAIFEYMACGKPIVKPREKVGDTLRHLESGFLLEDRRPRSYAEAIIQVLHDEQLAERLGSNARSLAVEKYDWEPLAESYLHALQSV